METFAILIMTLFIVTSVTVLGVILAAIFKAPLIHRITETIFFSYLLLYVVYLMTLPDSLVPSHWVWGQGWISRAVMFGGALVCLYQLKMTWKKEIDYGKKK